MGCAIFSCGCPWLSLCIFAFLEMYLQKFAGNSPWHSKVSRTISNCGFGAGVQAVHTITVHNFIHIDDTLYMHTLDVIFYHMYLFHSAGRTVLHWTIRTHRPSCQDRSMFSSLLSWCKYHVSLETRHLFLEHLVYPVRKYFANGLCATMSSNRTLNKSWRWSWRMAVIQKFVNTGVLWAEYSF